MTSGERPDHPADDISEHARHDRRYKAFAIGLALVVLAFAAISITVVITTTSR